MYFAGETSNLPKRILTGFTFCWGWPREPSREQANRGVRTKSKICRTIFKGFIELIKISLFTEACSGRILTDQSFYRGRFIPTGPIDRGAGPSRFWWECPSYILHTSRDHQGKQLCRDLVRGIPYQSTTLPGPSKFVAPCLGVCRALHSHAGFSRKPANRSARFCCTSADFPAWTAGFPKRIGHVLDLSSCQGNLKILHHEENFLVVKTILYYFI